MKLVTALRQFSAVPSLLMAGLLVTACATAPARPPAPISTGQPRTEPEPPPPPPVETTEPEEVLPTEPEETGPDSSFFLTPEFMEGRNIRRVGVLLPFSHSSAGVRSQASGLLAAIEMALFDQAGDDILIIPRDTAGDARQSAAAATEVINDGADVIIGPLFSTSVQSVSTTARAAEIPVIAFSNDRSVAGGGAFLMSFPPEEEVARIVDYTMAQGIRKFAFMGPSATYARRVETALRFEVARRGGVVIGSEFYAPDNEAPVDEARRLANQITGSLADRTERVAVMIPDNGVQLRAVAPLLPYYEVNLRQLQYIGTSTWNDPQIWREPVLENAIFAMPDPQDTEYFRSAFQGTYNTAPASLASLGYDAAALAISFLTDGRVTEGELLEADGFRGVNGLFRFRQDGTIERGLSIMSIRPSGPVMIEDSPDSFVIGGS